MKLCLILGDNLHEIQPDAQRYFMAETADLAKHFTYHTHKLVLIFAAMRNLATKLENLTYYEYQEKSYVELLAAEIKKYDVDELITYEIEDKFFDETIRTFVKLHGLKLTIVPSRKFMTSREDFRKYANGKPKLRQTDFYIMQRKAHDILLVDRQPEGGRWSFDEDNRKKFPKDIFVPPLPKVTFTQITRETMEFVKETFPDNPGRVEDFLWPTTHEEANMWLEDFLENRLDLFGPYEDAIHSEITFGFHSMLSPLINIGLLEPKYIIDKTVQAKAKLQSREGFIRQIMGWREFIRGVYHTTDTTNNLFGHTHKLTCDWYDGTTGIEPLDIAIKRADKYAYTHHIERLMVIGNCMLLCQVHPDDVYKWFMEMYIDSADWVMEPNVYAMSQFADDYFATKPYICGSNYIRKMSNYKKGGWCDEMDGLYWNFIVQNKPLFAGNHRMSMMVKLWEKKDPEKQKELLSQAKATISRLTTNNLID